MGVKAGIAAVLFSLAGLVLFVQAFNLYRRQNQNTRMENITQDLPIVSAHYNYNYTVLDWQTQNINVYQNRNVDYSVYSYIVSKQATTNGNGNSRTGIWKESRLLNSALPIQPGPEPTSFQFTNSAPTITNGSTRTQSSLPLSLESEFNNSFSPAEKLVPQIHDCVVMYLKGIHSHSVAIL